MNSLLWKSSMFWGTKPLSSLLLFKLKWTVKTRGFLGTISVNFFFWFGLSVCQTCLVSKMKHKPCTWIFNKLKNYQHKSEPISQTKANKQKCCPCQQREKLTFQIILRICLVWIKSDISIFQMQLRQTLSL